MDGAWILHFDGLCEPRNPGGWICWAWTLSRVGEPLLSGSEAIPPAQENTNNVAEYIALGKGLRAVQSAVESGNVFPGLVIIGDSQLVIRQINREWKCNKPEMGKLRDRCLEILSSLTPWRAEWVPREYNAEADELGRKAYFAATGRMPPERGKR